jgi:hypothetical protein
MNKTNLLVRYDKDLRLRIMYPGARKEITRDVVRILHRTPGRNVVSFTFANEHDLHRVIHDELDYFLPLEQPLTWKVYEHDLLPSLKEQLISHGFVRDENPANIMVLDLKKTPAILSTAVEADVRRIEGIAALEQVIGVLDRVWGGDHTWVRDRLGKHLQIPGYVSVYAAYVGNQPASIAWTHFPRGTFATLSPGSTIAQFRRQGLYTSLLATSLQEIRDRGYSYAVVDANALSQPLVEKHGFQHLTTVHNYKWHGN